MEFQGKKSKWDGFDLLLLILLTLGIILGFKSQCNHSGKKHEPRGYEVPENPPPIDSTITKEGKGLS